MVCWLVWCSCWPNWPVEFVTEWLPGRILNTGSFGSLIAETPDTAHTFFVLPDDADCWPAEASHNAGGQPLQISSRDTWTVYNDLSVFLTTEPQFSPSPGFGLHMERQTFHFTTYPLAHGILVRTRLINKSNADYPEFYVGIWNDPDVGSQSSEDLVTLDSTLWLSCTYSNPSGGDIHPVAYGLLLLQGATVPAVGQTAHVMDIGTSGIYVKSVADHTTVGATAGTAYPNNAGGNCGQTGNTGDICRYNYLKGLKADGSSKPGGVWDPLAGRTPSDQRTILSSGPFTLAAGDTQDVWYVMLGAQAATSLIAVDSLKVRAALIRNMFGLDPITSIKSPGTHGVPKDFVLHRNSPNPFNPSTTIRYELKSDVPVTLKIFNTLGHEVRTLVDGVMPRGIHEAVWDGRNEAGQAVSSGVYLYQMRVGQTMETLKMTLLK